MATDKPLFSGKVPSHANIRVCVRLIHSVPLSHSFLLFLFVFCISIPFPYSLLFFSRPHEQKSASNPCLGSGLDPPPSTKEDARVTVEQSHILFNINDLFDASYMSFFIINVLCFVILPDMTKKKKRKKKRESRKQSQRPRILQ